MSRIFYQVTETKEEKKENFSNLQRPRVAAAVRPTGLSKNRFYDGEYDISN